jgi:hypothetical protein
MVAALRPFTRLVRTVMRYYCIGVSLVFFLLAVVIVLGKNNMADGLFSLGFSVGSGLALVAAALVKKE